ncbi:MAG: hypothetical protein R3F19_10015 [Verrucomicrobiales bacterium]
MPDPSQPLSQAGRMCYKRGQLPVECRRSSRDNGDAVTMSAYDLENELFEMRAAHYRK